MTARVLPALGCLVPRLRSAVRPPLQQAMEHADTGLVCQALPTLPVQALPRRGYWSLGPALPPLPLLRFARISVRPRGPAQPCRHMHEGSRPATCQHSGL